MANIAIVTTAEQDKALQRLTNLHNERTGETLTLAQFVTREVIGPVLQAYVDQLFVEDFTKLRKAWEKATPDERDAARAALKVP